MKGSTELNGNPHKYVLRIKHQVQQQVYREICYLMMIRYTEKHFLIFARKCTLPIL
jgi:hypothetical protein